MTFLALSLALPLLAAVVVLLARRLPRLGSVLTVVTAGACLALAVQVPSGPPLDVFADIALDWTPVARLFVLALWLILLLFGLLEFAQPGHSFVLPITLAATALAAASLVLRPLSLAFLAFQVGALLLVFPALAGPARRPWGSLGYLALTVVGGSGGLMALWLADFYTQNPDETTARAAAMLLAVVVGLTLALVPLHLWLPRLTETSPFQVSAWIGLVGQTVVVGLLLRLLTEYGWLLGVTPVIQTLVLGGLLSMALGGGLALLASTPRHWLAYAMIHSMGLVAVGMGLFGRQAAEGSLLVLASRGLALLVVAAGFRATPRLALAWDDVRGLVAERPFAALALAFGGAVFAGTPPLAGFPGAWVIYRAAFAAAPPLAYLMLPGTALMGLSVVRLLTILFRPAEGARRTTPPAARPLTALIIGLLGVLFVVGWLPQLVMTPLAAMLAGLRFLP